MAVSKQRRASSAEQKLSMGLVAIGASGPWEIAVDERLTGPERYFVQIEGPSAYLYFAIESASVLAKAAELLQASRPNGKGNAVVKRSRGELALGKSGSTVVSLVPDDEFPDRFFLLMQGSGGLCVRFTIAGDDRLHLLHALQQIEREVADDDQ